MRETAPYTALAEVYDAVMAHVDYEGWAAYVHDLARRHAPDARDVLELACGTASLALHLQPRGPYRYRATDASFSMLRVARRKAEAASVPLTLEQVDFTAIPPEPQADLVVLLYDSMNYLLEEDEVLALLRGIHGVLRPGGVCIMDQSTPANSLANSPDFEDADEADGVRFVRKSHYDRQTRLHTTALTLHHPSGATTREVHVERAYTMAEVQHLIAQAGLEAEAAYHEFTFRRAHPGETERVHWVFRRERE